MKNIFTFLLIATLCFPSYAQNAPQLINYQAVARDNSGLLIKNKHVSIRATFLEGSSTGNLKYQEIDTSTTNSFGLFTIQLGGGQPIQFTFSNIDFSKKMWLEIEMDPGNGTYYDMGTTQLISVPYALYAEKSGSNANLSTLTLGYGLTGSSYNGSSAVETEVDTNSIATQNYVLLHAGSGSGGTVKSVSAGAGMNFTTITTAGAVSADTANFHSTAYDKGLFYPYSSNPSGYLKAPLSIGSLASSTISGVSLGGTLLSHSVGYGLSGSIYNGSSGVIWSVDTTTNNLHPATQNYVLRHAGSGSGGTVSSVSAGAGMNFTTITNTGTISADTAHFHSTAYDKGLFYPLSTNPSGYLKAPVANASLANSTISGVSLGGALLSHSVGYGLSGSIYNGSSGVIWSVDTTTNNLHPATQNYVLRHAGSGSGGTVSSVSAGAGMNFTTITNTGTISADTAHFHSTAYDKGLFYPLSTNPSGYLKAPVANASLANSTISGVSLGGSLLNHSVGYGLSGSIYNGSSGVIWSVDTTTNNLHPATQNYVLRHAGSGSGGTVSSVSAGAGMNFTTITNTGTISADTAHFHSTAYNKGQFYPLSSNPSGYLTAPVQNVSLAKSTISGVSLGGNLNNLTSGYGLSGGNYNGSTGITLSIDTSTKIATQNYVLRHASTGSSNGWNLLGNSIGTSGDFIGTTDNSPLVFKQNGIFAGEIGTSANNFFGTFAGANTTGGSDNSAIGYSALYNNSSGGSNTASGSHALFSNISGSGNTAVGAWTLQTNQTGINNTIIGVSADVSIDGLTNATAIGANAIVGASNSLVLGGTGANAVNVGIGTSSPNYPLDIQGSSETALRFIPYNGPYLGSIAFSDPAQGASNICARMDLGFENLVGNSNSYIAFRTYGSNSTPGNTDASTEQMRITSAGNVGIGAVSPSTKLHVISSSSNVATFDGASGMFITLAEGGVNRGYIGSYSGNASDVDFGTYSGNTTGNLNFTIEDNIKMTIANSGNIGIGTTTPNAPLHIAGTGISLASQNREYFALQYGNGVFENISTSNGIVVQADGWYYANNGGFLSTSDSRIKNVMGITDNRLDLEILSKIQITNFKYIDGINNGDKEYKKVIAQQVKGIYPNAVKENEGFIPNVYELAESVNISGDKTIIKTCKPHDFKTGDVVKLILEGNGEKEIPVIVIDENTFSVSEKIANNVFVYGKKVNDLLNVDYDALSMLNVSATQELIKEVNELKKENEQLKLSKIDRSDFDKLKAEVEELKNSSTTLQAQK